MDESKGRNRKDQRIGDEKVESPWNSAWGNSGQPPPGRVWRGRATLRCVDPHHLHEFRTPQSGAGALYGQYGYGHLCNTTALTNLDLFYAKRFATATVPLRRNHKGRYQQPCPSPSYAFDLQLDPAQHAEISGE